MNMKIYVRADAYNADLGMFDNTPFVFDTDVSWYNNFLNAEDAEYMRKKYNRVGDIVMMSPKEYFSDCSKYGFPDGEVDLDHLTAGRRANKGSIEWLENQLDEGNKFYLPYLNYADHKQEGLHRMMVAGDRYGWDTEFPVLVVKVDDPYVEHENKIFEAYLDFRNYKFDDICRNAAYVLEEWTGFPEDRFGEDALIQGLKEEIIKQAKDVGADIDVEIEMEQDDDIHVLHVYISRFEDYDSSDRYEGYNIIFEDYADINHQPEPSDTNYIDFLLNVIDLNNDNQDTESL